MDDLKYFNTGVTRIWSWKNPRAGPQPPTRSTGCRPVGVECILLIREACILERGLLPFPSHGLCSQLCNELTASLNRSSWELLQGRGHPGPYGRGGGATPPGSMDLAAWIGAILKTEEPPGGGGGPAQQRAGDQSAVSGPGAPHYPYSSEFCDGLMGGGE